MTAHLDALLPLDAPVKAAVYLAELYAEDAHNMDPDGFGACLRVVSLMLGDELDAVRDAVRTADREADRRLAEIADRLREIGRGTTDDRAREGVKAVADEIRRETAA